MDLKYFVIDRMHQSDGTLLIEYPYIIKNI